MTVSVKNNNVEQGHFLPIIDRNTVIPVSKNQTLYTANDNQDTIRITNIAKVFPLVFFVVAILICLTSLSLWGCAWYEPPQEEVAEVLYLAKIFLILCVIIIIVVR